MLHRTIMILKKKIALIPFIELVYYEVYMLKALFKLLWDVGLCNDV